MTETLKDIKVMLKDIVKMYETYPMLRMHRSYEYWKGYLAGIREAIKITLNNRWCIVE